MQELSDAELAQHCLQGHQGAWRVLVLRYQRLVFTVARRAGQDEHAAADILQSVFEKLFKHLPSLTQPERLRAWVVTTARREVLTLLERQSRLHSIEDLPSDDAEEGPVDRLVDPSPLADEQLQELQEAQQLLGALDQMDERCRALLTLLFADEEDRLPYDELARRLQMPEGSIGPTRKRCLDKLRKLYLRGDGRGRP